MRQHINSTRLVRTYNASTVLRTLYEHGRCSRSQLTELTGMSPATITRIVYELLQQGVIKEGSHGRSTGGRRPVYLHIDHTKLYLASVKLLRDDFIVALLDLKGQIIVKENLQPKSLCPHELLANVAASLTDIFASLSIKQEHIIGVGVSASGICHPIDGVVIRSLNLGWKDVAVADILGEALGLPVLLENDANACALAELWIGNARETTNSMYIKTESGAGVGIISNKTLLTGSRFVTGEIGHVPLIPGGKLCRCGQRGCLEPYVYFKGFQESYKEATGQELTHSKFIELLGDGDAYATKIVQEAASALALACAHWGLILDIETITIGGIWGKFQQVIEHCQTYYDSILEQSVIPSSVTILNSSFDDVADLLGAAGLVVSNWFTPASVPFERQT
ncbi:MAG TPA: ROK family protein [Limnochordia bacterium]|nr:ROK family protein [Limnochordia bacterium]